MFMYVLCALLLSLFLVVVFNEEFFSRILFFSHFSHIEYDTQEKKKKRRIGKKWDLVLVLVLVLLLLIFRFSSS